jgi:hypothetical protein
VQGTIRALLISLALAGALTLLPAARAGADAPLPPDYFGVNLNRVLFDDPEPAHAAPLGAARAAGITHGRVDLPWSTVQPTSGGSPDYRFTDEAIGSLAAQGIQPTPMLGYSAPWAAVTRGNDKTPPRDIDDYAHFALLMAMRYGPGGSFWATHPNVPYLPVKRWEIWNEPNLPQTFWQTGRNPALYARMYLAARAAIRGIDPTAKVIVGGLHSSDIAFLTDMYDAVPRLTGNVDGVAIHPYAPTVRGVLSVVRQFRAALDAQGDTHVPMEVTEVGWQRAGHTDLTVSESTRAADIAAVADSLARSDCHIDAFEPYTWESAEQSQSDGEDWYGLWSASAGLLPSGQAYAGVIARYSTDAARAAARSTQLLRICHPPQLHVTLRVRSRMLLVRVKPARSGSDAPRLSVATARRAVSAARVARRVAFRRGFSYFKLGRSVARVMLKATAHGFAKYSATFRVVRRHGHYVLRLVEPKHGHGAPTAPVDNPSPVQSPPATTAPHSDPTPCPLPSVPSTVGGAVQTLPTTPPAVTSCEIPASL